MVLVHDSAEVTEEKVRSEVIIGHEKENESAFKVPSSQSSEIV